MFSELNVRIEGLPIEEAGVEHKRPQTTQLNSNLKENEQMKKLCRYSIIDNNKPKEKLARLGETWNHKSRMTVCAISWQMP